MRAITVMATIAIVAVGLGAVDKAVAADAFVKAPAWVLEIAPGTWAAVSKNTPADIDPRYDPALNPNYPSPPPWAGGSLQVGVIRNWNGGALATGLGPKGSLLLFGGGHNGYYGNEVYAFDLESRLWTRLTNPYPNPVWKNPDGTTNIEAYPDGWYPDGTPSPPHTYDQADYDPVSNSFVIFSVQKNNLGNEGRLPRPFMLSLNAMNERPIKNAADAWSHGPINTKQTAVAGGWSAYDKTRKVFWLEGGNGTEAFSKFDPVGLNGDGSIGAWTNYPRKVSGSSVASVDPLRDILVVDSRSSGGLSGRAVFAIDLKNPEQPGAVIESETAPIADGPPMDDASRRAGFEWSDTRQSFLWWRRGGEVYELRLVGADWRKSTSWKWSRLTSGQNTVSPEDMDIDNGVLSRFRIARYAEGEVAVVINNMGGPVFAFRVPPLSVPNAPGGVIVK